MTTEALSDIDNAFAQIAYRAGQYREQVVKLTEEKTALEGEIATLHKKLKPSGLRRLWLTCRDTVVFASLVWIGWVGHVVLAPAQPVVTYTGSAPRPTQERRPPRQEQPQDSGQAPASAPLFVDATPEPTYDNAAYNATAQASKDILIVVTPTEEDRWADGEFWTEEEQAAFAATDVAIAQATTTAFIENVPTPAPDVVIEMREKCADAALVARSPLLQLWCTPEE